MEQQEGFDLKILTLWIAFGLAIWRASSAWQKMSDRVDSLWNAQFAQGQIKLENRGVLRENSPISLGDAVREAMKKGIPDDMLEFFRERSKKKLPSNNADLWIEVEKKFGILRLKKRAIELGWDFDELQTWWIQGLRNPHIVEEALKRNGQ